MVAWIPSKASGDRGHLLWVRGWAARGCCAIHARPRRRVVGADITALGQSFCCSPRAGKFLLDLFIRRPRGARFSRA